MSQNKRSHLVITKLPQNDRPREKVMKSGLGSLSDSELLAILIRSGSRSESAVDLAKRILNSVTDNFNDLARLSIPQLKKFKGIGEVKAMSIAASLELGRRRQIAAASSKTSISSSRDAQLLLGPRIADLEHEEFWVLLLNRANKVLHTCNVSSGGVSGTVVDSKLVYRLAVQYLASSLIVAHNHPSGSLKPSSSDKSLTQKLKEAGDALDIKLLDHLIISQEGYFSFADEGLM